MMTPTQRSLLVPIAAIFVTIACACRGRGHNAAATKEIPNDVDAILETTNDLWNRGNLVPAFEYISRAVTKVGDDPRLLECYNDLAVACKRHEVALDTALRLEQVDSRKSPWNQLKIAEALLHLDRPDEAIPYIERAVNERSFRRWSVFDSDIYDPLRKRERFQRCIEHAKSNIGIGSQMPDLTVRTLDGRTIPLRSLAGKVVLIDFWATWCQPCVKELPNLHALYSEHSGEAFEIVGLSLDAKLESASRYVKEKRIPWPICHLEQGWKDPVVTLYGVNALPDLWLYDRTGTLRHYNVRGEALRHALEALL
jgi:thiol-disulfide isomerase/thioredoxin